MARPDAHKLDCGFFDTAAHVPPHLPMACYNGAMSSTPEHWDERYRGGDLPWDIRRPETQLTEIVTKLSLPRSIALDLGCGTGENTRWLARHGYEAIGIDISSEAIRIALQRTKEEGVAAARFFCGSVTDPLPVTPETVGLALDRGCFHALAEDERPILARQVAVALAEGGWWLILCGNADQHRAEGEEGPPRLQAREVIEPVDAAFEVHALERSHFTGADGRPGHLAWRAVLRKRSHTRA
jgi:methyl halide transferase